MTTAELAALIDEPVMIPMGKMIFQAVIVDAQHQYGNVRVLVRPEAGEGETWLNLASIALVRGKKEASSELS